MAKNLPTPADAPAPEPGAWTPAEALREAEAARVELSVRDGDDRLWHKGPLPWSLRDALKDPEKHAAIHKHLTELNRQQAAEDAQNDWLAALAYGSAGGAGLVNAGAELQRTELELAKRQRAKRERAKK